LLATIALPNYNSLMQAACATHASEKVTEGILEILNANPLMAMATTSAQNHPTANYAYFAFESKDKLVAYFMSEDDALHCANLATNPRVSCAFHIAPQKWGENLQGLRLDGTCERLEGMAVMPALHAYATRFNAFKMVETVIKAFTTGHEEGSVYKITFDSGKILDETRFDYREYIEFKLA